MHTISLELQYGEWCLQFTQAKLVDETNLATWFVCKPSSSHGNRRFVPEPLTRSIPHLSITGKFYTSNPGSLAPNDDKCLPKICIYCFGVFKHAVLQGLRSPNKKQIFPTNCSPFHLYSDYSQRLKYVYAADNVFFGRRKPVRRQRSCSCNHRGRLRHRPNDGQSSCS